MGKIKKSKPSEKGIPIEDENKFVISLANELFRMKQNIQNMDDTIKGVRNLKNRVESMLTLLATKGYDMPNLLGETYNDGYNMIVSMEFDERLEPGSKVIKRVVRPQVNYNGVLLQTAEIIVAYNE